MGARRRMWLLLLAAIGVLPGCANRMMREQYLIDVFSAETRALEDKLYQLENRLDRIEERDAGARRGSGDGSRSAPAGEEYPDSLVPPRVDLGSRLSREPNALRLVSAEREVGVDRVILGAETRSMDYDPQPGDDGLQVVLQVVAEDGSLVSVPGSLGIILVDQVRGSRLARWQFTADELDALFIPEVGYVLDMAWAGIAEVPEARVFVRLGLEGERWDVDRSLHERAAVDAIRSDVETPSTEPARPELVAEPPVAPPRTEIARGPRRPPARTMEEPTPARGQVASPPDGVMHGPPPSVYRRNRP